ncbi:CoB--CoM heterodisulfide reductase iron-sulfur subunit A family protein [Desulfolucanica intricata]|uniref:CoB--CoM heterodisulfide reductase iron-sulfur subunit A family protein n=1 Tax=Desulfolucanica intricata TaxID=1285191 RepID=UPI00082A79DF|nr:CoB--CoM heterodisulfide reductase iron-sulfur subunit A family protein [Desulfolucanica intricata]
MTLDTSKPVTGSVLVVGAGIAGIQASLDLAESGYYVYLVEKSPAIGGTMPMLDKTFPTNDCSMCILSPKLVECGRHLNVEVMTTSLVEDIQGEPGNFTVTIKKKARYVDIEKCTGCGSCAEKCPKKVTDEFDQGLRQRKAIYKPYAQAFPNAYAIDPTQCLKMKKPKACGKCIEACQAGAINHQMQDEIVEINVGSVILVPGFEKFDASKLTYYGYGKYAGVVTSLEFERLLSASGPFGGHLIRPADEKEPKKIAWIQCVGSRNEREGCGYCSAVCCMYAIKEAVIAKEHCHYPLDTTIFFMDMRTYGKDFEKYYDRAKNEHGVNFVRSRIYDVVENEDKSLTVRYANEDGSISTDVFDMVVLSIGLKPSSDIVELANKVGIELNKYNFCEAKALTGVETSKPGIYVAGAFSGPRDIPETVIEASAAAGAAAVQLAPARGTLVKTKEIPEEINVYNEIPRTGVFVCHCGINIGSVVDVPATVEYAKTLPGVVYAQESLYVCSQDAQAQIKEKIAEYNLNRVVVASCTPRTHEPLFQESLTEAGLNPYLFEMANIRDQCSWVHQSEPEKATEKAKDLVKMAVAKAQLLTPLYEKELEMNHDVLVIGGGISGMVNALNLADQGYKVNLIERTDKLGGIANRITTGLKGEDIKGYLADLINKVTNHANINVFLNSDIQNVQGYLGNYSTTLTTGQEIKHGVAVIANGGREYKPTEYLYGENNRVLTQLEMEEAIVSEDDKIKNAKNVVLINCVGSRDDERPYCSRVCCNKSIKLALKLKEKNPDTNVYILYRDIRSYGFYEDNYREARSKGVIFIRYAVDNKPVAVDGGDVIKITVTDHVLGLPIEIEADVVGLAAAILPQEDNNRLSQFFKVPLNPDGFFLEAHLKLRPVDFSTDGVYMCGLAHGPKTIEENIAQAKAAASRASTALSKENVKAESKIAMVNNKKCAGCGVCESVCPSKAISIDMENQVAVVNEALCKGCGACASSCRCGALNVKGFTNEQIVAMISAL